MAKKNITIDDLAVMVQKGFEKTSTKDQVEQLEFRVVKVEKNLETVKDLIVENHKKRIEKIEAEIKELRELFAM